MNTTGEEPQPGQDPDEIGHDIGHLDSFLRKLFGTKKGQAADDSQASALRPSPDSSDFVDHQESELVFMEPGTFIGRFKIIDLIGFGGFGVVYHAVDEASGQELALKIPRQDRLNSAQVLKRFYREARLARDLKHRSIVEVIETSIESEHFYIASAYQKGMNLKTWLEHHDKPVAIDLAVAWGIDLADALQYAFLNGIVHRDLKPTNILIVKEDPEKSTEDHEIISGLIPRITDFGLAYSMKEPVSSTSASGMLIGTPGYMAPEQVLTGMNRVDIRADIYALGLIMAEMLAGVRIRKFDHLMEFVVHLTRNDPTRDLDILKKKLPIDLHCILLKSIDVDPEKRYQTPSEMLEDLRRFQRRAPIQARPMSRRERLGRFIKRKPYQAALVLVSASFLSYFLLNRFWQQQAVGLMNEQLVKANSSLTTANRDLEKALNRLQGAEKNLIRQAYNSSMRLAYSEFRDGHVESAQDILDMTRRMKYNPDENLPEFSWRYLSKLTREKQSGHHAAEFDAYLPEPHGTKYRQIYEQHRDLMETRRLLLGEFDMTEQFAFFRSGFQQLLMQPGQPVKYVVDSTAGTLEMFDGTKAMSEKPATILAPATRIRLQFEDDPIMLADRSALPQEFRRRIQRRASGEILMPYDIRHFMPIFSMNGRVILGLVKVETHGKISLEWCGYNFENDTPFNLGIAYEPGPGKPKISATPSLGLTGRWVLAFDENSNEMKLFDLEMRQTNRVLDWNAQGENANPVCIAFDEVRQRFIVGDSVNRIRAWKVGQERAFAEFPNRISNLSDVGLLPDGQVLGRIAYSDRVWVWNPDQKPNPDQRLNLTDEVWSLAFDPTGKLLVGAGDDDRVHVWNLVTGEETILEKHESLVSCGRFSPDGTRFATCDFSGWLRVWKVADWTLENRQKIATEKLRALAWGPDNRTIVAVGNGKSAWGWLPGDVQVRPLPVDDISHDIIHSPKNKSYIVSQQGIPSALLFLSPPGLEVTRKVTVQRRPMRLALSPDESRVVVSFQEGGFEVYRTDTCELIKSIGTENTAGTVKCVLFLNDGRNLIVSGGDSRLTIYETETWEPIGTIMDHASQVNAMAISADGLRFASGDMFGRVIVRKTNP